MRPSHARLVSLVFLGLFGCGSADTDAADPLKPDADGFYPTNGKLTPRNEINNALLFVEPARVVLAPNQQATIRAFELDIDGQTLTTDVVWEPSGAGIGVGADYVIGLTEGVATLKAVDPDSNREASIEVEVVATPVAGPQSMRFSPAAIAIGTGETLPFTYEVLDGVGNPIPGSAVEWVAEGGAVQVEDGQVLGVQKGLVLVQAKLPGADAPLAGQLIVSVGNPQPASCEEYEEVTGCFYVAPPTLFTGPDAADKLVLGVSYAQYGTDCNRLPWIDLRLEHPTKLTVLHPKVLNVSGGLLAGVGPGNTRFRAYVGEVMCGERGASSTIDYNGDWSFECSGGVKGSMGVEGWLQKAYHAIGMTAAGAVVPKTDFPVFVEFSMDSCTSGEGGCSASEEKEWNSFFGGCASPVHLGECKPGNACCGLPLSACDGPTGSLRVEGPNLLESDNCTFKRGGSCGGTTPPSGAGCFFNNECSGGNICNTGYPGTTSYGGPTDGTCRPRSNPGEKCRLEQECVDGHYCQFDPPIAYCTSTTGKRGVCAPKVQVGAACECPAACTSQACSAGSCI
jgi:hypothetical protein